MRIRTFFLLLPLILSLTHCLSYDLSRKVVQQGNLLPASKVNRLHTGMSKEDIAVLLGTSLLSPLFDNDRWDYVYTCRTGARPPVVRNLTLYFSGDRLVHIERH